MNDGVRKMYVGKTDYVTQQTFQAYNQMTQNGFE